VLTTGKQLQISLLVAAVVAATPALRAQTPNPLDIATRYEQDFLARFYHCSFRSETELRLYGPSAPQDGYLMAKGVTAVVRGRHDHIRHEDATTWYGPIFKPEGEFTGYEIIHDGDSVSSVGWDGPNRKANGVIHWHRLQASSRDIIQAYQTHPACVIMFGWIDTKRTLRDSLSDRPRVEAAEGGLVTVSGKTEHGTSRLLLDPSLGYAPRSLVLTKAAGDLHGDHKLSAAPINQHWSSIRTPTESYERTVTVTYAGKALPCDITIIDTEVERHAGGQERKTVATTRVRDLKFNPDLTTAFRPRTVIPDGTYVNVETEPTLEHEWRDGKVVKTGATLEERPLLPPPPPPEGRPAWQWALMVCLLSAVAAVLARILRG
jgi:hypothetical protein